MAGDDGTSTRPDGPPDDSSAAEDRDAHDNEVRSAEAGSRLLAGLLVGSAPPLVAPLDHDDVAHLPAVLDSMVAADLVAVRCEYDLGSRAGPVDE